MPSGAMIDKGEVLGQRLRLYIRKRESSSDPVWPAVLYWGESRGLVLDDSLPLSLARLIPSGFATSRTTPERWQAFVKRALGLGLL